MGRVYEAEHVLIGRRMAVKCLHAHYASDPATVARFHLEAQAATSVGNEHIIEVTDMGRFPDGSAYMVLEYLDGSDLATVLKSTGALPIGRAVRVVRQICEALIAAHPKGIVHRDLKPENIFLIRRGDDPDFVKVLDFGISKFNDGRPGALTATGAMVGTPAYMAPEQIECVKDIDSRADIYALGTILHQCLTGRTPFYSESVPRLVYEICALPPPALRTLRLDAPEALEAVLLKLLAKAREERYSDCSQVRDALAPFVGFMADPVMAKSLEASRLITGTPAPMHLTLASQVSPAVTPKRSRVPWAVVGIASVALCLGAAGVARKERARSSAGALPRGTEISVTPTPVMPSPSPTAAERTVRVRMSTDPDDAELLLDGNRVANPFDAELPQSTEVHRLEARRGGFRSVMQDLVLQYAQTVRVRMRRGSGVEDQRARRAAPPSPRAPAVTQVA